MVCTTLQRSLRTWTPREARQFSEEAYALAHDLEAHELMILTTQGLAMRCHLADDKEGQALCLPNSQN